MSVQNIKIEYEDQSNNKQGASNNQSGNKSGGASEGLSVNGLALDSLINLLSQSNSKYSTITIKEDNSILIS